MSEKSLIPGTDWNEVSRTIIGVLPKYTRGPQPTVALADLLIAKIRQKLSTEDSVEEHLEDFTGIALQGSTISRRMRKLRKEDLERIGEVLLKPLADERTCPEGFYHGYRLVGVDGTKFSLQNTEGISARIEKPRARSSLAERLEETAYPQMWGCTLVELGLHNPLAATVGCNGEGELSLGVSLLGRLGAEDLLLGDRLYGVGWFAHQVIQSEVGAFLLKVKNTQTSRLVERLPDGSALVEVKVRSRKRPGTIIETVRLREITYRIEAVDENGKATSSVYRLWTNLLDVRVYPAEDLIRLYTTRWGHERFYAEMKLELQTKEYLDAQLVETACVEIFAMVWACALAAHERLRVAQMDKETPAKQVSFTKLRSAMATLLSLSMYVDTVITPEQFELIATQIYRRVLRRRVPTRNKRVCPRKVRKKQKNWPKLRSRTEAPLTIKINLLPPSD